jgi:L-galactose dehydrogenase
MGESTANIRAPVAAPDAGGRPAHPTEGTHQPETRNQKPETLPPQAPSPVVSEAAYPSELGFGAAPLGRLPDTQIPGGRSAVRAAVDAGIAFFDVSPYYGPHQAEEVLGDALRGIRDGVRICTKAGRFGDREFDFSSRAITRSLDESLRRLQTDYVDVFLAHDVEHGPPEQIIGETVETLLRLKDEGKCRSIGVSGYPLDVLRTIIEACQIDVALSYCHCCLFNDHLVSELLAVVAKKGVLLINGSPLGMGLLTDEPPPPWHPAPPVLRQICREAADFCHENGSSIARHALQFALDVRGVAITLVGMESVATVTDNVETAKQRADTRMQRALASIFEPVQGISWQAATGAWMNVASSPANVQRSTFNVQGSTSSIGFATGARGRA